MTTVCILSQGERGEGRTLLSVHADVNCAKRAAWWYVDRGDRQRAFPLLDWYRDGNYWRVVSPNGVDYLEIHKMEVQE